jgi:hypothetical protein
MFKRIILWLFVPLMAVAVLVRLFGHGGRGEHSRPGDPGAGGTFLRFETYVLQDDPSGIGGEVSRMLIPAGWKTSGGMAYDLNSLYPAQVNLRIFDPNSSALFATYPCNFYIWGDMNLAEGTNDGGAIVEPPSQNAVEAIEKIVVPQYRPELAGATVVETEELPKLAELALEEVPAVAGTEANVQAGRVRFEYEVEGKPVQEDFFAMLRVNAAQGFQLWNTEQIVSVRADKGKLDEVRQLHEVSARSVKSALPWFNKYAQFLNWRHENAMAFIQSVGEMSRQISQNNDAIDDSIRQQYEKQQAVDDQISEARSETMRGETPWDEGDGNKVLLPADYDHAWRDGNGQYVVSTDPLYDPNSDPNLIHSNWTSMQALQH